MGISLKQIFKGLRFRVFLYMALFAAGLLTLLYVLQITLLPSYYENQVFQQVESISSTVSHLMIEDERGNIDFNEVYRGLVDTASSNNLCIYVFDEETYLKVEINSMGSTCYLDYLVSPTFQSLQEPTPIIQQYVDLASQSESSNYYFTVQPTELMSSQLFYGQEIRGSNLNYYMFINTPYELVDSTVSVLQDQFLFVSIIVFILSMVVAFIISRQLSKPLVDMSNQAQKLAKGEKSIRFPHGGYTEIDNLADTLNYAATEIQKTDNLRNDLLANISHDIRTPLTMISGYAEMIQDISQDDPEKRQEHLQIIINEVENLNLLLADMMTLSQVQSETARINITEFDLVDLTKKLIETYNFGDIEILYEGEEKARIQSDKVKTRQVIQNYLTNAVKFSGEVKEITVKIINIDETGYVRLEVIDNGPGISHDEIDQIWDRYYKLNRNYQRAKEGTGLGLAITKAICERMNLPYGVISEEQQGSLFYVEFPTAK